MAIITRELLNKEMLSTLKRYNGTKTEISAMPFILSRFMHYMFIVLMHGHPVSVRKTIKFQLVYNYLTHIPRNQRSSYSFPSRAFGYVFYLTTTSKQMIQYKYTFRTSKPMMRKIVDYLESDIVYKLIKK